MAIEKLYVLGHPVAHSKSPDMHNAAYRALGLDWEYGFADCATEAEARAFLARRDWLGLNITMPWKPLAFETATWRSDAARLACGANVLVRRGDELLADNTDGKGCVSYLRRCGVRFEGAHAVVCGTGPTSLSIMHAVAAAGAARVVLLGRDDAKARRVLDGYRERSGAAPGGMAGGASNGVACGASNRGLSDVPGDAASGVELAAGSYERRRDDIAAADVILDATPLGMKAGDPAPFDTSILSSHQVVFDVVYAHGATALVAAARARGCATYDGSGMLVAQAVETVRDIVDWLSVPVDPDAVDLFSVMAAAAGFEK